MNTIEYFIKYHSDVLSQMKECLHFFDNENPNPYHFENDLYTHTMMVYNRCDTRLLQICAILHDIGKPMCREVIEETKRVRFCNHENASTVLSIWILKKMVERKFIFRDEMIEILYIVNYHTVLYNAGKKTIDTVKYLPENIKELIRADHLGRVCLDDKGPMLETLNSVEFVEYKEKGYEIGRPILTLNIGLPCSGKSTGTENKNAIIISRDKYIEEIGRGNSYNEKWNSLGDDEQKNIDALYMKAYSDAIKNKDNIIIDMTNLSVKTRRKFLSIKNDYFKVARVFLTDLKEIEDRSKNRLGKYISRKIMNSMIQRFKLPTHAEGFDKIEIII